MDNFVIGNMVWNAGLVAVAGFFVKHWMSQVEDGRKINAEKIDEDAQWTREQLFKTNERTTREIKEAIHENRVEYARQSSEIKESIDKLSDHAAVPERRPTPRMQLQQIVQLQQTLYQMEKAAQHLLCAVY